MKRYIRSSIGNYRGYNIEIEKSGDQRYYFVDEFRKIHYADLEEELKSKIDKFIEQKSKPVEATIAWTGEPDSYYNEWINRLADQRLESRIHSWGDAYKEFVKIADKYFPDDEKIDREVNKLYFKHSKNPYFQEAWKRWGDSAADPED